MKLIELVCPNCNKTFKGKAGAQCCSRSCSSSYNMKKRGLETKRLQALELEEWYSVEHKCEVCGKVLVEKYGSGRFCNKACANVASTKGKREEINKKVSEKLKGKSYPNKVVVKWSEESKKKQSERMKVIAGTPEHKEKVSRSSKGREVSEKTREKLRILGLKRYADGVAQGISKLGGRSKKGWYKGVWCDSSWELAFVVYYLENDLKFEINNMPFSYEYEGVKRSYYPDFKVGDAYIEIKNYEKPEDKYKWAAVPNLKVLYRKDVNIFIEYTVNKYGKKFWERLYEDKIV